ncbi:MAG: 50S ribosomal protein L4 [Desulfurococcales archaeon]|jgi:large subunit ribosomal protein L4e|nr:50S ribosomal protein L4 [Desulfurococcales archaeon]
MEIVKIVTPRIREVPEVDLYDLEGKAVSRIRLPEVFTLPVRIDIIRRAHHASLTASIQPQGRDPLAGKRRVGESWGIGYSVARVPRLDNGRAVIAPMTRGGRRAHAPTAMKVVEEDVNRREKIYAIASAIAATSLRDFVIRRGHRIPENLSLPVVVVNDVENIPTSRQARDFLKRIGLWVDVERAYGGVRIRAGKGKRRGRRYIEPKSILLVVSSKDASAIKAFRNLPGVDVAHLSCLGIQHLAPGGVPGRLMVISEGALGEIGKRFRVIYI